MNRSRSSSLRDHEARRRIAEKPEQTFLVEAAAGTGKTTAMVGRMVGLLREGLCRPENMAAVTFTRKAAAELRARFQFELEKSATGQDAGSRRIAEALGQVERCVIGTIHSFCARILRERPVEAGVNIAFREVDEREDSFLREEAWSRHVAGLFAGQSPVPERLGALGLDTDQLKNAFMTIADYPDVQDWPAPEVSFEEGGSARTALLKYIRHMNRVIPAFPDDRGTDALMDRYEWICRLVRNADLEHSSHLIEILELFNPNIKITQKIWTDNISPGKEEKERWLKFCEDHAVPLCTRWREMRYAVAMPVLHGALEEYDRLRREKGVLNYQDLLLAAARLLRENPKVRRYFHRRFSHLLVDEFQDTDPVQAEIMLLLTASDPKERDWRYCRPRPGSLFVVGDPKQSIYRFRRADIVTYDRVRRIIEDSGGETLRLTTNFRSGRGLLAWGNKVFDDAFPREADTWSPASSPMDPGREEASSGNLEGVMILDVPERFAKADEAVEFEAGLIARVIRRALDEGLTVPRSRRELDAGLSSEAAPGDFMIVAWRRKNLARYARRLQELDIPHQVTGGGALNQVGELSLLVDCVRAVTEPENAVALLSVLRGELFGVSDSELYDYRRAGGHFSFLSPVPEELAPGTGDLFNNIWGTLRRCAGWLRRLPPIPALEKITAHLGLTVRALAGGEGDMPAGCIAKAFQLLRKAQPEFPTAAELVEFLRNQMDAAAEFDGLPARASAQEVVRIMNLHKAKGLEAPVVFLADPTGKSLRPPVIHIDRTGDRVSGYLTVSEPIGDFQARLLAQPPAWETRAIEERRFADAEKIRLFYVAATRASSMLVVTRKNTRRNTNYWDFFSPCLEGLPILSDPGRPPPRREEEGIMTGEEVTWATRDISARQKRVLQSTYRLEKAAQAAPTPSGLHRTSREGEHGTEWGRVLHLLLEASMRTPEGGLIDLARSALEEQGLPAALAARVMETVDTVRSSNIWHRAAASEKVFPEVPYTLCLPEEESGDGRAVVMRGIIDLVFRESDGWVIVDYKSDDIGADEVEVQAEKYRTQLDRYEEAWRTLTGDNVSERGLYFISPDVYLVLP